MSFDIFVVCLRRGDVSTFPRAIVEKAFGAHADRSDPRDWTLTFAGRDGGDLYIDADAEISDFSVNRPSGDPLFWDIILDILRQTGSVLYWPGGGAVVADPEVGAHMPADMIEALGKPIVAHSGKDITDAIEKS